MNEDFTKLIIGLILGSVLTYLANKKIKFTELQIQYLMEKLKKYDALWESYLRLISVFEDPNFRQRWNNSQFDITRQILEQLNMNVDRDYRDSTFFMSEDMGLIHIYVQKKIFQELCLRGQLEHTYFENFKIDLKSKMQLMCDLVKAECSKEVLAKHLIYESFFEFDLMFSNRLQNLKDWRLKREKEFSSIKTYIDTNISMPRT